MMKDLLDYYFFKFHKTIFLNKEFESTYINNYVGIAALISFNFLTVLIFLDVPFRSFEIFTAFVAITIVSYLYCIKGGRWRKILEKFDKCDPYPVMGKVVVIGYFALTIIALLTTAYMRRNGLI